MKAFLVLSLASVALSSVLEGRNCAGNNCNRQVTGTRAGLPPLSSRSADCSSFMAVRVTPATRTITFTEWVAPTGEPEPTGCGVAKRDFADDFMDHYLVPRQVTSTPSAIPAYASSCDNRFEYSSACNCFGVPERTTTVRAPRTTSTVTAVATNCPQVVLSLVPACAHQCFADIAPTYGCTGVEDLACQCANFEPLGWAVTPCVQGTCTEAEVDVIFGAAQNACRCFSAANPAPTS